MYKKYVIPSTAIPTSTVGQTVKYYPSANEWQKLEGDSIMLHRVPPCCFVEAVFDSDENDYIPISPMRLCRYDYQRFRLRLTHKSALLVNVVDAGTIPE